MNLQSILSNSCFSLSAMPSPFRFLIRFFSNFFMAYIIPDARLWQAQTYMMKERLKAFTILVQSGLLKQTKSHSHFNPSSLKPGFCLNFEKITNFQKNHRPQHWLSNLNKCDFVCHFHELLKGQDGTMNHDLSNGKLRCERMVWKRWLVFMRSCSIKRQQRAPANTITLPSVGNNCRSSRKLGTSPKIIKYSFVCCFVFFIFCFQFNLVFFIFSTHI